MKAGVMVAVCHLHSRWREVALISIGIMALLSAALAGFDLLYALKKGEAVYSVSVSGLSIEGELQGFTQESRRVLLYALMTTNPNLQLPYVKAAREADAQVNRLNEELAKISLPASARIVLLSLRKEWQRYVAVRSEIIGLILEDRTNEALVLEETESAPLFDACARRLRELKQILGQFARQQLVQIRGTYYRCAGEVGFMIITLLLFIASFRMLSTLRGRNQHLSHVEVLERHRSRILEAINQNIPLADIFTDISRLVERQLPRGLSVALLDSFPQTQTWVNPLLSNPPLLRIFSVPIPGTAQDSAAALEVFSPKLLSLREDDIRFCERAAQLASLAIEHHRVTGKLAFQAEHDGLTGLANRVKFQERLLHAIRESGDGARPFALLWIDLDRFKQVNDMFGHHVGDCLLQETANRLSSCVSSGGTIARFGGDEFVILLPECPHPEQAAGVAHCILEQLNKPLQVGNHDLSFGASIGVGVYPDHGQDSETLLRNADAAMYSAKCSGKNMFRIYDAEMGVASSENLEIGRQLRTALENREFELYYQPQCAADGAILGAEALLRWTNPVLGSVSPNRFIPIAEENGVIVPLGEWVLREACRQAAHWQRGGCQEFAIAVNVSAHQFVRSDFAATVASVLEQSGIPPRLLELELTESTVMQRLDQTIDQMNTLRALGVHIAVDDFGTGASSLSYLTKLPIDSLKIHRSFVSAVDALSRKSVPLIRAIVGMAQGLRLKVVAEGVETVEQLNMLEAEGCQVFQGFHFHKPVPSRQMADLLFILKEQPGHTESATHPRYATPLNSNRYSEAPHSVALLDCEGVFPAPAMAS